LTSFRTTSSRRTDSRSPPSPRAARASQTDVEIQLSISSRASCTYGVLSQGPPGEESSAAVAAPLRIPPIGRNMSLPVRDLPLPAWDVPTPPRTTPRPANSRSPSLEEPQPRGAPATSSRTV
jgi:hypothetical protein